MKDFRELTVWQDSHKLTLAIYEVTKLFPKEELFILTNQMRRSSSSIPTNIAEGCGRGTNKEFAQFLQIAMGSAYEIDYQLILAKDLNYIQNEKYLTLSEETNKIQRKLASLLKKIRSEL
jgi:four helix bundle protein